MATFFRHPARTAAPPTAAPAAVPSPELPPLLRLIEASGRRWFLLGTMLLVIMGLAVWAAHRDPLAISGLFFAIAAILRTIPKIIEESARILREVESHESAQVRHPQFGAALGTATIGTATIETAALGTAPPGTVTTTTRTKGITSGEASTTTRTARNDLRRAKPNRLRSARPR